MATMPMMMMPMVSAPTMMSAPMAVAKPQVITTMPQVTTIAPQVAYSQPQQRTIMTGGMPTSGSYAPPVVAPVPPTTVTYAAPAAVTGKANLGKGSYAAPVGPPVMYAPAPMAVGMNVVAPAVSSSLAAVVPAPRSYAPMPVGPTVMSGSYAPPVSGSYTAPPLVARSGSYVPQVVTSGSYTAPPMMGVPRSGSYGPPGMMSSAAPAGLPQMMVPVAGQMMRPMGGGSYVPPPRDPRELPDPDTVLNQRNAYKSALDQQFQQAISQIEIQRDNTKQMLRQSAQQEKDQFSLQANSNLEAKKLEIDTALNSQLLILQETAMQHRKVLEEKASVLTLDYQQRKANEDLMVKQYQIQKNFVENERQLEKDFQQKQKSLASPNASPSKAAGID